MSKRKDCKSERGSTLIEVIFSAVIILAIVIGALQFLLVQAGGLEMEERARRANDASDQALESLTARLNSMGLAGTNGGGSLTVAADNRVTLGTCSFFWCDKYLVNAEGNQINESGVVSTFGTSFAGGTSWTAATPATARREFVRRWRIARITGRPDMREITVGVFSSDTSTEPIVLQTTRIAVRTTP